MELLVELLNAIAWPSALVWISYLFRQEVRDLLSRVSQVKYRELEAKFDKELAEAEAQVIEVRGRSAPSLPAQSTLTQYEQLRRIAEISPRAAITEAWALIELAAAKAGLTAGKTLSRLYPRAVVEHLSASGEMSEASIKLVQKLRALRNQAAHLPEFSITYDEAERYLDLAVRTAEIFSQRPDKEDS